MKKLTILLNDEQLRDKFAKRSIEIIKNNFDINKKIKNLIKLYCYENKD